MPPEIGFLVTHIIYVFIEGSPQNLRASCIFGQIIHRVEIIASIVYP